MTAFELVAEVTVNETIGVRKYKSRDTGLTVVLADVNGPLVNGYFTLATEAHDDDGLPHTLEHLIFLGSEHYPFKGVLDLLANRCLASGTNAWTDQDHTCYTMTTAGSEGFLELMPIYLDHILYPKLSDSGYLTEVHHVSGKGEDGGVVYCEMQGRENSAESRAHLQLLRLVYPNSGYSAETGGILDNIRNSTNNQKVRDYHAAFYRPENLTIIITGKVEPEKVFKSLQTVEDRILWKNERKSFVKPWRTPVSPLTESHDIEIRYPSDEEDCGLVFVGFRGPNCCDEHLKLTACSVLLRYLADTSVSPLQRNFVEITDPYASKVSHCIGENLESLLYFSFEDVTLPRINYVLDNFNATLHGFINGDEKIDMKRMRRIIEREILQSVCHLENSPHDTIAFLAIADFLYGNKAEDFKQRFNIKQQFESLLNAEEAFWLDLLQTYLVDGSFICVRAFPSIEEQARMSKEETARLENQRNQLGPSGLQLKEEELKKAMAKNEIQPPESMLTQVPVPSVEGIHFHSLNVYKSTDTQENEISSVNFDDFPVYAEVYDILTNFVYITATINTDSLEPQLRPYLLLFLELLRESPVRKGEKLITHGEVVAGLEKDTIGCGSTLGLDNISSFSCGVFSRTASVVINVDFNKYEAGVNWMKDLLFATEFVVDRVRVCASKKFNAVSQAKRKGNSVVRDLLKAMLYEKDSNIQVSSMLRQQKFLGNILAALENAESAQNVIDNLTKIRATILQPNNISLHIAANLKKMSASGKSLSKPWIGFVEKKETIKKTLKVTPDWEIMKVNGIYKDFQGTVVGLGCVESAFLYHAGPSIKNFMDPDISALMLFIQYLTQLEGPLWRQIRGQGFAYGYNIVPLPHEGLLCLSLYRATNVIAAFKEAKKIIENQFSPSAKWDKNLLESARSSLIFEIIEREKSVGSLVIQSLLASFKQVVPNYNQTLVKKINQVTEEDLQRVGEKYISKLFGENAKTAIVCHPEKVKQIAEDFKLLKRNLKAVSSLEESILA